MKKYLIALLLACNTYLSAAAWMPNAKTIPLTPSLNPSVGVDFDVTVTYFPKIKKVVAAWADSSTRMPYYSTYDGIADMWSTAALISSTNVVHKNVNLQSFPFKKILIAAWADQATRLPYYSYFDGSMWTLPQVFVVGNTATVTQDIGLAYDKAVNRVIAAWGNLANTDAPTYSTFDTTLTWTMPTEMYVPLNFPVQNNIHLAYNKISGEVIAAWAIGGTKQPTYSSFTGGAWSEPAAIATVVGNTGVHDDVRLVYDRMQNLVLAAWSDEAGHQLGYGASYNGSFPWTATGAFNLDGSVGIYDNASLGYNLISGVAFTVWQNSEQYANGLPYYNTQFPSTAGAIPPGASAGVSYNINIAYDQNSGKMVAVWANYPGTLLIPYYNTYQ